MTHTDRAIERFNPSTWNQDFGYDQAQLRTAPRRILTLAGQAAISDAGVPSDADMATQLGQCLDNIQHLLHLARLDFGDVVSMTVFVTDMDAALAAYSTITTRLGADKATPPATLIEVSRLALPSLLAEITVTAGR